MAQPYQEGERERKRKKQIKRKITRKKESEEGCFLFLFFGGVRGRGSGRVMGPASGGAHTAAGVYLCIFTAKVWLWPPLSRVGFTRGVNLEEPEGQAHGRRREKKVVFYVCSSVFP